VGGRIDAIFYCPHAPEDNCTCRKPAPGLYEQIAERYGMDLAGMPTVGDSVRDLKAGVAVGCAPHLVLTGKSAALRGQLLPEGFPPGTLVHEDLAAFAQHLVSQ
jgi:D-glycero-D-manno-heptose 1,7-bisphosphate phosphatase